MLAGMNAIAGFVAGGGAGSLWAEASDADVHKTGSTTTGSKTLTSSSVAVTAHGGAPGYTYAWTRISGSSSITAVSPTGASTAFTATLLPNQELSAVFQCTVTDSSGATAVAGPVSVDIELISFQ